MCIQTKFDLKEIIPALSLIMDHQASGNLYHGFRVSVVTYHLGELEAFDDKDALFYLGLLHDIVAYRDWETDRKSTRLNSSHSAKSRMPSSA